MEPARLERSKKTATFHVFRNLNSHQELFVEKKIQSKSIAIILGRKCLAKKIIEYSAWWEAGWHFTFLFAIKRKDVFDQNQWLKGIFYFHSMVFCISITQYFLPCHCHLSHTGDTSYCPIFLHIFPYIFDTHW